MSVFLFFIMPPQADPYEIVGWEYIQEMTGFAQSSILARKCGIKEIPLARRKPLGWFRLHVDSWLKDKAEKASTPKKRALKLLDRSKSRRRARAA